MGNPRKPAALKAIAGTGRKDRPPIDTSNLPVLTEVPAAPDWLPNAHAVKEWNHLARILVENKLVTEASLASLGMHCALHGKIVQLYAAGESPTASMAGTLRASANDFGLTPVSQGKVKPVGDSEKENPFKKNGRREAEA